MSTLPLSPALTPWSRLLALAVMLAAIVSIVVLAFAWPAVTSTVKDLPVAISGSAEGIAQLKTAAEHVSPGTITFVEATDRADAVAKIESRQVYGAIVAGAEPEVLTASAASPIATQLLTGLLSGVAALDSANPAPASTSTVRVTDVVPLASSDPRGAGLAAAAFPLTMGGILGGILTSVLVAGAWRRVVSVTTYAVVGGLALAAILQGVFHALQGTYLLNAAAISLTLLAISAVIVGAVSLVGRAGVLVGPVVFLLIANPISSAGQPLEFLPQPWGAAGQWFPPGAGATLLRDLSYFSEAPVVFPWLVLTIWAAIGITLALIGHFRKRLSITVESTMVQTTGATSAA